MMRARRPNFRSLGTGASASGAATGPRTPGIGDVSPVTMEAVRLSRAALSSGVSARARLPRRGVDSESLFPVTSCVEGALVDVLDDAVVHQVPDRHTGCDPAAAFRGADRHGRLLDHPDTIIGQPGAVELMAG